MRKPFAFLLLFFVYGHFFEVAWAADKCRRSLAGNENKVTASEPADTTVENSTIVKMVQAKAEGSNTLIGYFNPGMEMHENRSDFISMVNAVQIIRASQGLPPLEKPESIVNKLYLDEPSAPTGINPAEYTRGLRRALAAYAGVETRLRNAARRLDPNEASDHLVLVDHLDTGALQVGPRKLQVLTYAAWTEDHKPLGIHTVLLVRKNDHTIGVLDPTYPETILDMAIANVKFDGRGAIGLVPEPRIFVYPSLRGAAFFNILYLNTIEW